MDNAIFQMLDEYKCHAVSDYENALKEIIQEIALLGLWRAKFFEHALFYGGTALRILYHLPRFSEDLDFSLLRPSKEFNLSNFHKAIKDELEGFGFHVEIFGKEKAISSQVESAFIKADTKINFLKVRVPVTIADRIQGNQILKIKVEVDTDPPGNHGIEVKDLYRPIPFQVKTMPLSDLFAGKVHAVLARAWGTRVKGRDFFDYLWYLGNKIPLHLKHLEARLLQSGHLSEKLDENLLKEMLEKKFSEMEVEKAKADLGPFLKERERATLDLWTRDYFIRSIPAIKYDPT